MKEVEIHARALVLDYLRFCTGYEKAKECAVFSLENTMKVVLLLEDSSLANERLEWLSLLIKTIKEI